MRSPKVFGEGIGALLVACALIGLVAVAMAFGTPGSALAQGGAPGPITAAAIEAGHNTCDRR